MKRPLLLSLLLLAAVPYAHAGDIYFNRARGFHFDGFPQEVPFILRADTAGFPAPSLPLTTGAGDFTLALIFDNLHNTPDRNYRYLDTSGKRQKAVMPGFNLILEEEDGRQVAVRWSNEVTELPVGDEHLAETILTLTRPLSQPASFKIGKNKKRNRLALTRRGNQIRIEAGSNSTADGLSAELPEGFSPTRLRIVPEGGAEFAFHDMALTDDSPAEAPKIPVPSIREKITYSSDSRAGYWAQAGFTVDNNFIVSGGDYIIALLPISGGGFSLYYMEGARVNSGFWKRGMEKCRLTPRADGIFSAHWRCADGRDADPLATAIFRDGNLTITFPSLHGASLTLRPHSTYTPSPVPDSAE